MDEAQEALPEMESPSKLPSLPVRALQVFVSPGKLFEALREEPRWFGAMLLGGILAFGAMAIVPAEVWTEWFRLQMLESGQQMPEGLDVGGIQRIVVLVSGLIAFVLFTFILAGLLALIFTFILGDEGRYKQYLAIVTHAGLIGAFGGLLMLPIRIIQRNPQATLNLGLFTPFLGEGYLLSLFTMLDFFSLWGTVVMALGVASLTERRSWGSATAILLVITVGIMAFFAIFA